jgi:UDP-N-acetylmuramoyl-tripeptide--D-alanyl-D-alanine ligase
MSEFAARPVALAEIVAAGPVEIVGDLPPETAFRWIERDSRHLAAGDLFIAVRGERFDGHQFVSDAAGRGAVAALVAREWVQKGGEAPGLPLLVVDDPVAALQRVAAARRRVMTLTTIGITGSIGKTSAKEAIAAGIGHVRSTYKSPGNMNSEIGLPLSILEIPDQTEVAVLEMGGAYAFGEVALLAKIARPLIGVVTNVYPVHLERMGSIEAIAETKTELVASLPASGFAILNVDNPWVAAMAHRTSATVITFGREPRATVRASAIETRGLEGIAFRLEGEAGCRDIALPMAGAHSVELALAAICAGMALGIGVDDLLKGLAAMERPVRLVPLAGPNGSRLIDDTYNASAPSVLSALRLLGEIPCQRRIAVLGDMRELGSESTSHHETVGRAAAECVDLLITFGPLARIIARTAAETAAVDGRKLDVQSFGLDQREELTRMLLKELRPGDAALLKGSRGLEMETIVASLRDAADPHADA